MLNALRLSVRRSIQFSDDVIDGDGDAGRRGYAISADRLESHILPSRLLSVSG